MIEGPDGREQEQRLGVHAAVEHRERRECQKQHCCLSVRLADHVAGQAEQVHERAEECRKRDEGGAERHAADQPACRARRHRKGGKKRQPHLVSQVVIPLVPVSGDVQVPLRVPLGHQVQEGVVGQPRPRAVRRVAQRRDGKGADQQDGAAAGEERHDDRAEIRRPDGCNRARPQRARRRRAPPRDGAGQPDRLGPQPLRQRGAQDQQVPERSEAGRRDERAPRRSNRDDPGSERKTRPLPEQETDADDREHEREQVEDLDPPRHGCMRPDVVHEIPPRRRVLSRIAACQAKPLASDAAARRRTVPAAVVESRLIRRGTLRFPTRSPRSGAGSDPLRALRWLLPSPSRGPCCCSGTTRSRPTSASTSAGWCRRRRGGRRSSTSPSSTRRSPGG